VPINSEGYQWNGTLVALSRYQVPRREGGLWKASRPRKVATYATGNGRSDHPKMARSARGFVPNRVREQFLIGRGAFAKRRSARRSGRIHPCMATGILGLHRAHTAHSDPRLISCASWGWYRVACAQSDGRTGIGLVRCVWQSRAFLVADQWHSATPARTARWALRPDLLWKSRIKKFAIV
jgi:hypothetical protein